MPARAVKPSVGRVLFGTDETVGEPLALRAGPLEVAIQGARLLAVHAAGREIWHGVDFLYRDPDWGTPEPVIEHVQHTVAGNGFHIRLDGHFPVSPVITLRIDIEGAAEGRIRFTAEAVPAGDIQASRIGLCLLHPMSAMGARIEVKHADGRLSQSTFPTLISPWPPFMLIRAIRHEWAFGCWARCDLAGDVFELEDQRNNSDASFKTYSRSNLMPRPYWLRAGVPIRHSADLRLEVPVPRDAPRRPSAVSVGVGDAVGELPRIGIEISARDALAPEATRAALRVLRPPLLHLALDGAGDGVDWRGIGELLAAAHARLRLDLTIADAARTDAALETLGAALRDARLAPESIAIFPSGRAAIDAARRVFPGSAVGGGTPHFFAQLNRLEGLVDVDFASFTTSPIVHGASYASVMLSLQSLPSMIDTLHASYPGLPVRIGPSTIAARASPLGGQPVTDGTRRVALARQDPRCRGLYGAAWVLGYVAQFATAGAQAITLMSLTGPSGVVDCAHDGRVVRHPAYFLISRLGGAARVCSVAVSDPTRIAALAISRDGKGELLLANLTGQAVELDLQGWPASAPACILDADTWHSFAGTPPSQAWQACGETLPLPRHRLAAYAVASLRQAP